MTVADWSFYSFKCLTLFKKIILFVFIHFKSYKIEQWTIILDLESNEQSHFPKFYKKGKEIGIILQSINYDTKTHIRDFFLLFKYVGCTLMWVQTIMVSQGEIVVYSGKTRGKATEWPCVV